MSPRSSSTRTALALAGALLLAALPAEAGDIWLGLGAGQVKPENINATVVWSGELRLGMSKHFALQPDIGYWKRSETVSGISVSASDFTFGVTGLLVMPLRPVTLYIGAGPSVHHISGDVDSYGFSVASDSLTRVGLAAVSGIDIGISQGFAFFLGARYDWVPLETDDPDNLNQRRLYGGFRLRL